MTAIPDRAFAAPASPTRAERATALAVVISLALGWFIAVASSHLSGPWDNVEQLVWTQALQWGYYKHPPLPSWLLSAVSLPFGPRIELTWAMGVTCVAIGLWLTWRLGCELLGARYALIGLLLSTTVAHYSVRSLYYNHNLAMLPFVSGAALLLHHALRDARLRHWIGLGAVAGLAALCKYQVVVFAACWAAAVACAPKQGPRGRGQVSRTTGIAAAATAATVIVAPHVLWLVQADFLPFQYADAQLKRLDSFGAWLANLGRFAGAQLARCAPVVIVVAFCAWRLRRRKPAKQPGLSLTTAAGSAMTGTQPIASPEARRYLLIVGLGPFALTWLLGVAGMRLEGHWSAPELLALGLVIVAYWPAARHPDALRQTLWVVASLQCVLAVGFAVGRGLLPHLTGKLTRSVYPVTQVADAVLRQWQTQTTAPLRLVAGETWEAGAVALNLTPRALVVIDGNWIRSPGVKAQTIARCGAIVVWDVNREPQLPATLKQLRASATTRGVLAVTWSTAQRAQPVRLGWAFIPPERTDDARRPPGAHSTDCSPSG